MPDINTSFYPTAQPINLLGIASDAQGIKNAQQQNQLLQTENQRAKVGLSQDQVNLAHQQYGILNGALTAIARDPRITTDQAGQAVDEIAGPLVKNGVLPQTMFDQERAQLLAAPAAQRPQLLQNMSVRALAGQDQFRQNYGDVQEIDNGNQKQIVRAGAIAGVQPIAAPINKLTSPEFRAGLVPGANAQGQPVVTPNANLLSAANVDPYTGGSANPAGSFQPPGQGGSVTMGPAPGVVAGTNKAADVSADRYSNDAARETQYQQNILPMQQAYQSVKQLGATGVGPGAEQLNQIKSFAISMGLPIDPNSVNVTDEANKYLTQMSRQNGNTGSDAQLNAAQQASPSLKTSAGASMAVLQKMIAMQRLQHAQVAAFDASGQNPKDYSKWASQWNAKQNAAAYAFDLMAPEDRAAYLKTLSPEKLTQFKSSLSSAVKMGLVDRDQPAQPATEVQQ